MITVGIWDEHALKAEISGDFHTSIMVLRKLHVRDYDMKRKINIFPIVDAPLLKMMGKEAGVKVTFTPEAKIAIQRHFDWRKEQEEIAAGNDEQMVDGLNDSFQNLKHPLLPYQVLGAAYLYNACMAQGGAMLLDWVGMGKTPQSLSCAEHMLEQKDINFNIIVCSASLKFNWEAELEKFTDSRVLVIDGTPAKRKKQYKSAYKYDYMIINFELLIRDEQMIQDYILGRGYRFLLTIDEIQKIKNPTAQRSKSTKALARDESCCYAIGLTATLYETKSLDVWSAYHVVHDWVLGGEKKGSFFAFKQNYTVTDFFGTQTGLRNTKMFRSRVRPYQIRRFKEDVLDQLPKRNETTLWTKLTPTQQRIYDETADRITNTINDETKEAKIRNAEVLELMLYLRMCTLSPELIESDHKQSTKLDILIEYIRDIPEGEKVVVFCFFAKMVEIIHRELERAKIPHIYMHGTSELGKDQKTRFASVNEFNASNEYTTLVTSDILTEGINIPSAKHVINFDILWNPAKMEQRAGRIDRLTQQSDSINIVSIVAKNTIDEHMYETYLKRRKESETILDGGRTEGRLTVKTLIKLLEK